LNAYRDTKDTSRTIDLSDFRYQDRRRRRILANTKGVLLQEYDTQYGTFGTVAAPQYDLMLSGGVEARTFSSVASMPYGILLAKRLSVLLGKEAKMNGPIRVFWPPRVTAQIFGFLAPFFTEDRLVSGRNFLAKGRNMEEFWDHRILLLDDGSLSGGLRTRSFDDRGAAPVPLTLIREGKIDRCFLSVASARRKDTRATGHSLDGDWKPTNLHVRGGTRSLNALMSEMDQSVFYIDHLCDVKDGLKMSTGDVDLVCSGTLMRKGEVLGVVRNVRLKGNLTDSLRQLVSLSSDTDRFGHIDAPGMVLDGFEVVGPA
jgi:predicted Zn-dependent protease